MTPFLTSKEKLQSEVKILLYKRIPDFILEHLGVERLVLRLDPRGKNLGDERRISELDLPAKNAQLYFRDLGPQIGWKTVSLNFVDEILLEKIDFFFEIFVNCLLNSCKFRYSCLSMLAHSFCIRYSTSDLRLSMELVSFFGSVDIKKAGIF